jgi:hypothetical protein
MRHFRAGLIVLCCLPLTACFEEPVREHVHLTIRDDDPVIVTVVQEVASSDVARGNLKLAYRLDESRDTIEQNLDPWSRRFALLSPLAERLSVERLEGELRRSIHSAVVPSFDEAVRLIEADGLTGSLTRVRGSSEVQLYPTGGSRATYLQRQDVERRIEEWSEILAVYFEAVADLYAHLDERPDRAVPIFAHIFDKHEGLGVTGPLDEAEEELLARAKTAMEEVSFALLVPDDDAFSLNELTRLVYDPFPARLTIAVEGQVLSVKGWIEEDGFFERPAVDAWNALRSLEGRWISPDLVTAVAAPVSEDQQPDPDVLLFASLQRRFSTPPASDEVEAAIQAALVPEDELILRWRGPPRPEREFVEMSFEWLAAMAAAEAEIP